MPADPTLAAYYAARASEYELVYAKPERQADLAVLHRDIPEYFAAQRVLEIACGTGYWTEGLGRRAARVVACDVVPEVLAIARAKPIDHRIVTFREADAFDLASVGGPFNAAFAGFLWSHVLRAQLPVLLRELHARLTPASRVLFVDNRYVEASSQPITRIDDAGNTFQQRRLQNGEAHEVLKNFPASSEVRRVVSAAGGNDVIVHELTYYWYVTYRSP